MNLLSKLRAISVFLLPGLLLAGCSTAAEVGDIEITFDGERCQYEGPESIVEGEILIVLNNPTDHQYLHLHVFTWREGKTWQDYVEYVDGRTIELPPPVWILPRLPTSVDGDTDRSTRLQTQYFREWEYSLDPGSFGIVCAAHRDVRGIWSAGPLEVRADS